MAAQSRFNLVRVLVAILAANVLPILALVIVVLIYSFLRSPDSATPEEFAPVAGNWVGPIGGFLMALVFARWVAKRASERPIAQGFAVGLGATLLDIAIGLALAGTDSLQPLCFISNAGRILAGILGGWLGAKEARATQSALGLVQQ
ncbi:hypothetical protein BH10PLA2_BH10PLA2_40100 [soil metagenome]